MRIPGAGPCAFFPKRCARVVALCRRRGGADAAPGPPASCVRLQLKRGEAEPVEPAGLPCVALAQQLHDQVGLGRGAFAPADLVVDVLVVDAGPQRDVDLMVGVLLGGALFPESGPSVNGWHAS